MTLERRRDRRYLLQRPIKVQCDQTGVRYLAGSMVNISAGGAMLTVERAGHLRLGQQIRVLMTGPTPQALLRDDDAVAGTVVRCLGWSDRQHLAIRFDKPHLIAEAV